MRTLPSDFLTAREVSNYLKISLPWVRSLTSRRQIPHIRIGSRILYRKGELEAWLKQSEVTAADVNRNGKGKEE